MIDPLPADNGLTGGCCAVFRRRPSLDLPQTTSWRTFLLYLDKEHGLPVLYVKIKGLLARDSVISCGVRACEGVRRPRFGSRAICGA